jgi:cytochrome P450
VSFDHHDPRFVEDPAGVIGPIREREPLVHSQLYGGFWMLTRYEDVTRAALDYESFTSSVPGLTIIPPSQPRSEPLIPIELDPPAHARYRGLVNALFSRARIEELRPDLEALATRLLEPFAERGGGDVVAGFAHPMSLGSLARLMDLPEEDEASWFDWVERMFATARADRDDQREAVGSAEAYLDGLIAERHAEPRDDFLGLLLEAEVDGRRLSDAEVRQFGILMLLAGYETTAGAMGLTLMYLAEHQEQRAELLGDVDALAHTAVNELLRYISPVQVFCRNAARDLELHGRTIPAGDVVLLAYGSANHDPRAFPEPDSCLLDRRPNPHVAFGHGHHLCLGANLARLELTIMLERLAELFPDFELDPFRPPTWKPRGDLRALSSLHLRGETAPGRPRQLPGATPLTP